MIREMYLRAYAQALMSNPEKSPEDVGDDAGFRVTLALAAPLLALEIVAGAVINRVAPGTFTRDSPSSIVFVVVFGALYFAVRRFIRHRTRSMAVPANVLQAYSTARQRLLFVMETVLAMGCIAAAAVVVVIIRSRP